MAKGGGGGASGGAGRASGLQVSSTTVNGTEARRLVSQYLAQQGGRWTTENEREIGLALTDDVYANGGRVRLARSGGRIVGAVAYTVEPGVVYVGHLGSTQRGTGSHLLQGVEDLARRRKSVVRLVSSDEATGFYEKRGYRTVSTDTFDGYEKRP